MSDRSQHLRLLEAILFASSGPLPVERLAEAFPNGTDLEGLLDELRAHYQNRGVNLVPVAGMWAFRTASDLADRLRQEKTVTRKPSRAAVETLAEVAYHQPVTRTEIEEIRGVGHSRGTLDVLIEAGWVKPGRRRRSPGRPLTWVTTDSFLEHFGLEGLDDLPGVADLKAAGLLDKRAAMTAFPRDQLRLVSDADEADEDPGGDPGGDPGADDDDGMLIGPELLDEDDGGGDDGDEPTAMEAAADPDKTPRR